MKKFFHAITLPFRIIFNYYWEILGILLFLATVHGLILERHTPLRQQVLVFLMTIGYICLISDIQEEYKNKKKDRKYWFRLISYFLSILSAIILCIQKFCL